VANAVARRGKRDDRAVPRDRPTSGKTGERGSVEVEHVGREAAVHGGRQRPEQATRETRHGSPFRPGDPNAPIVERSEAPDVIAMKMRQHDAVIKRV